MVKILEKDLFEPIYSFLTDLGYDVKGEVKGCDIAAVKDNKLIVVELKRSFSIELLFQAVNRQKYADSVYVAIPRYEKGYNTRRWKDMVELAKRLELGIIVVSFTVSKPIVEIALHPKESAFPKKKTKKRYAVIDEHSNRTGNYNTGGVSKTPLMTVYREQALHIAAVLDVKGELSSKELKQLGTCDKTVSILSKNFYKWFKRIDKKYCLTEEGRAALDHYSDLADYYRLGITEAKQ